MPDVARFQSWVTYDVGRTARLVEEQVNLAPNTPDTWLQLVIVEKTTETVIGDTAIHFPDEDEEQQVEVGINLSPEYQHRGFAAEALQTLFGYLFDQLNKHRIIAITDTENQSAADLFRRLGFRQEGHFIENVWFKGAYGSEYLFAMLKREWDARPEHAANTKV
ncbi:hypothetical protein BZG36_04206 [Bifiguratus adelaidae]|uniref:N-acetyltransferase domain-containing protein n=1 Tax=Bifiguratus adelaidae TaxID=1938954 RepID=A0A261XYA7_9FUNG|nr:hypothetical protein BZG36_04206 [Bifiguratus adelaidae]